MIGIIYIIGVVLLFLFFLLNDELKYSKPLKRGDLIKIIIVSLGSWVCLLIIGTSYLLSYFEDWLNEPLFKNEKKKKK